MRKGWHALARGDTDAQAIPLEALHHASSWSNTIERACSTWVAWGVRRYELFRVAPPRYRAGIRLRIWSKDAYVLFFPESGFWSRIGLAPDKVDGSGDGCRLFRPATGSARRNGSCRRRH